MAYVLQNLLNALTTGSSYALIALGYTMVYGVLRLINFAHGDVYMLGAFIGAYVAQILNPSTNGTLAEQSILQALAGIVVAMLICGLIGYLIERIAYRPLRRSPKLSALITAIGVSMLIEYLAQMQWQLPTSVIGFAHSVADTLHLHGGPFSVIRRAIEGRYFGPNTQSYQLIAGTNKSIPWFTDNLHMSVTLKDLIVIGTTAIALGVLRYIVLHTRMGKAMRAVSINYDAARLMGINIDRTISFTFVLGSMLAAVGGCLEGLNHGNLNNPLIGIQTGLKAFVAAVVGGIGNIPGAAAGGLLIALLETAAVMVHDSHNTAILSPYKDAIAFLVLIAVLLFRPEGLFGKAVPEKV